MNPSDVLILPGWQNSGPQHWQTLWEQEHGFRRVQQHDWMRPLRGDWMAQLEQAVIACDEAPVLVAHSLGCHLVAAWAAHSAHRGRVRAALLVAPADVEREDLQPLVPSWLPPVLQPLPFPSLLLASRDDPYCDFERARRLASAWGAQFKDCGDRGHINGESGLGRWPDGQALLQDLMKD